MSTKTKIVERNGTSKSLENTSLWSRAFISNSEWPDKEEFLDVVYWMRQFIGLSLFMLINAAVVYFYCINFQNINEDEYGGTWELVKEGFMTSFAGFLVTWVIIYSGLYHE
ncbi:hypothetical protein Trydic_g780 [Trypoxylus dichotomus]